ncbi:MAG: DUF58 domain-containing protein [Geodermatophilaceae bacterium]|nr:DUF58 domain-containing protein [Geodermatophilaceae bacterium]
MTLPTPARPSPTASPGGVGGGPPRLKDTPSDVVLRRLELTVRRRLDGLLQGNHLGLVPGPGSEAGESRVYHPGDDVRRMDWPVTARTTVAHVRETIADRELEAWIVVDLSPSLDFGTAACEKRDLAVAGLSAVVYLTTHGGNRVGALVTTGQQVIRIPARAGRAAADRLIRTVIETPRAEQGRRGDLASTLEMLRRPPRRRGLVVVVSDFLGEATWERPLRALAARHEALAIEVLDPRELSLPDVGLLTLVDPETGRVIEVQTGKKELRERFAAAATEQRADVAAGLRRCAAGHLQLRTDRDWLMDIVRYVGARRRGASGGARR